MKWDDAYNVKCYQYEMWSLVFIVAEYTFRSFLCSSFMSSYGRVRRCIIERTPHTYLSNPSFASPYLLYPVTPLPHDTSLPYPVLPSLTCLISSHLAAPLHLASSCLLCLMTLHCLSPCRTSHDPTYLAWPWYPNSILPYFISPKLLGLLFYLFYLWYLETINRIPHSTSLELSRWSVIYLPYSATP